MATVLFNERTHAPVATDVEVAETRASRRRGLLGRDGLGPSSALVLTPCLAVHTAFMRFPIDIIFLDRDGFTVKLVSDVAARCLAERAFRGGNVGGKPAEARHRHRRPVVSEDVAARPVRAASPRSRSSKKTPAGGSRVRAFFADLAARRSHDIALFVRSSA